MPTIYLSPSTQEGNYYVTGGSEETWMNRLADTMEPYLTASGIQYVRNLPSMTAASSIAASNSGRYDLHLALHSNAAPDGEYGSQRGLIADQLREIYPLPGLVRAEASTTIGEVRLTRAPSVFLELGYHDNRDDAAWIVHNLDPAARAIVKALCQYFSIPFLLPVPERTAVVDVASGPLNIRYLPSRTAPIVARAYDGDRLTVVNSWQGWDLVHFNGAVGYVDSQYLTYL